MKNKISISILDFSSLTLTPSKNCFVPKGHDENSPAFQRRERGEGNRSPAGTAGRSEAKWILSNFQPSRRDLSVICIKPSVETLGYYRLSLRDRCKRRIPNFRTALGLVFIILFLSLSANAENPVSENVSLRNEVQHSIDKGLSWLQKNQDTNGFWSTSDHPAVTALAVVAFKGEPGERYQKDAEFLKKSYSYLLGCAKSDGSICKKELANYNTSVSVMALLAARRSEYDSVILGARKFLIGSQIDLDAPGKADNAFDGGIGYGSHYQHSDLSNTLLALEAIYYSKQLAKDKKLVDAGDLNWPAAIQFLQNCQNLPGHNKEKWASGDSQNVGGFIYYPGHSMAGETNLPSGNKAFRSYGSASYAGLLSYIYADLKRDDPRVQAVVTWLSKNFTLEENPGMGPQGLFYYYHTMAKALTIYGLKELETADGKKINWREDLAKKIINLQKTDGSWANDNGRWWEKDAALVTAYATISLEMIQRGL